MIDHSLTDGVFTLSCAVATQQGSKHRKGDKADFHTPIIAETNLGTPVKGGTYNEL